MPYCYGTEVSFLFYKLSSPGSSGTASSAYLAEKVGREVLVNAQGSPLLCNAWDSGNGGHLHATESVL